MVRYHHLFVLLALSSFVVESRQLKGNDYELSSNFSKLHHSSKNVGTEGNRWAVLVAGSRGYYNYRHQADVCHAYQILKNGGLDDENIIVFMYDDIALSLNNPRPGVIINKPNGGDVYGGVPKDYTGDDVNVNNLFAAILGNKSALTGGSGKVVDSGPNDTIFIYYADHGATGLLGMPTGSDLTAKDLINTLKEKHAANSYKKMVIYIEACESGSMFEGILPEDMNIYAVTASNAVESSFATYCPGSFESLPPEFETCLGDLFSISWLEDSDIHDMGKETLEQQYDIVKRRTGFDDLGVSSHVMQYGNMSFENDLLYDYLGTNPKNDNFTVSSDDGEEEDDKINHLSTATSRNLVSQHDASLLHFWHKFHNAPEGSPEKAEARRELVDELSQMKHIDESVKDIIGVVFGNKKVSEMLKSVQSAGNPLVHNWDCFKILVNSFKIYCGSKSRTRYDMKYSGAFANMCNAGIDDINRATQAITLACSTSS